MASAVEYSHRDSELTSDQSHQSRLRHDIQNPIDILFPTFEIMVVSDDCSNAKKEKRRLKNESGGVFLFIMRGADESSVEGGTLETRLRFFFPRRSSVPVFDDAHGGPWLILRVKAGGGVWSTTMYGCARVADCEVECFWVAIVLRRGHTK